MKFINCCVVSLLAFFTAAHVASAQGSFVGTIQAVAGMSNGFYNATSLTLGSTNFVTQTTGDGALVPTSSMVVAFPGAIHGLSTSPTAESINGFLLLSSPAPGSGGISTTPRNRFNFTLTSLTDVGSGVFTGSGTLVDSTGAFSPTTVNLNIQFTTTTFYNFTLTALAPVPEPTTVSLVAVGLVGALVLRRKKV